LRKPLSSENIFRKTVKKESGNNIGVCGGREVCSSEKTKAPASLDANELFEREKKGKHFTSGRKGWRAGGKKGLSCG